MTPSLFLIFLWASTAPVSGVAPKTPAGNDLNLITAPMTFYLAKGSPDACGPGCREWIAAEGDFDVDAPERLRALLEERRNVLPIYFNSPGGLLESATSIGRVMRQKGMTAGVSKTIPEKCSGLDENACQRLKQSGQPLAAELSALATCASACTYALIGAKVRQVPPGAKLGVHSSKLVRVDPDGRVLASETVLTAQEMVERSSQVRGYVREMGIDAHLLDLVYKTPNENIYYLSRDEIVHLGIDTREFVETPWFFMDQSRLLATKFVSEAKGADRSEFRVSMLQLSCARSQSIAGNFKMLINVTYYRGLATDELGTQRQLKFTIGPRSFVFAPGSRARKLEFVDTGSMFEMRSETEPLDIFEPLQADRIEIAAVDGAARTPLPAVTRLSTQGLARSIAAMREKCAGDNTPAAGRDRPVANDRPLIGNESGHRGK